MYHPTGMLAHINFCCDPFTPQKRGRRRGHVNYMYGKIQMVANFSATILYGISHLCMPCVPAFNEMFECAHIVVY